MIRGATRLTVFVGTIRFMGTTGHCAKCFTHFFVIRPNKMVRHKKRWLLVQLYAAPEASSSLYADEKSDTGKILQGRITQKELHQQLRETFLSCFGVAGVAAASYDTQGMLSACRL